HKAADHRGGSNDRKVTDRCIVSYRGARSNPHVISNLGSAANTHAIVNADAGAQSGPRRHSGPWMDERRKAVARNAGRADQRRATSKVLIAAYRIQEVSF